MRHAPHAAVGLGTLAVTLGPGAAAAGLQDLSAWFLGAFGWLVLGTATGCLLLCALLPFLGLDPPGPPGRGATRRGRTGPPDLTTEVIT